MAKRKTIIRLSGAPVGGWMATFSDMNTLLLTFFVLLFSMSSIRSETFQEFFRTFSGDRLGLMQEGATITESQLIYDPMPEVPKNSERSALVDLQRTLMERDLSTGVAGAVQLHMEDAPEGVIEIEIADRILFAPGSAELSDEAREVLPSVRVFLGRVLELSNRRVVIEGHTDSTIEPQQAFVLSGRRAVSVLNFLLTPGEDDTVVLPPERFSVIGYGSTHPRATGDTPEDLARNRRVRIYLHPPEASIFGRGIR